MADKAISELIAANQVTPTDLFVLEQSGTAKKLTGQILENWLVSFADGHGGIKSIVKHSTDVLVDTYRITLADTTTFDFVVNNGRGINTIEKTGTSGLVDTYTINFNDATSSTFEVANGAKGDKGDNTYTHIKYASQKPTASSHSMGDVADNWIGIYYGASATAPTDWTQYEWFQIKGEKGETGDPAKLTSSAVEYQVSDSGTIIPSGAWSASVPVVAQGKYLWTRTTQTFNTGFPVISYSVSRMGLDGSGSVSSVANISPDGNGNVPLTAADIGALPNSGGDMTGGLRMNGQPISGLNAPSANDQAANMGFVNQQVRKAAHRNMLDNSYLKNPVNQRGQTSYVDNWTCTVDRWMSSDNNARVDILSNGIKLSSNNASGKTYIFQRLEKLPPGTYTFAAKFKENTGIVSISNQQTDAGAAVAPTLSDTEGILILNFANPDELSSGNAFVRLCNDTDSGYVIWEWAALYEGEYTAETLPEYQPKVYGAELLECQRYLQRFRTETERKTYCEDFRPTMRTTDNGVVSTFEKEIDGVTYYFASAEL